MTALARSPQPTADGDARVTRRHCDLGDPHADPDCEAVDIVFHLAGVAHQYAAPSAYAAVNVEGSLRLARAALAAGVRRFVYFSSVKAIGAGPELPGSSPGAATAGNRSPEPLDYPASKASAERRLHALCSGSAMELVILRPALVYAVDSPGHLAWLRRWVDLHMPAPPAIGARSMISREDLLRLAAELLDLSRSCPRVITATDGEEYSLRRLHAALCASRGRRPWLPSPPVAVWRGLAGLFDRLRRLAPGSTWQRLAADETYASQGLAPLGFSPHLDFEGCLRREAPR